MIHPVHYILCSFRALVAQLREPEFWILNDCLLFTFPLYLRSVMSLCFFILQFRVDLRHVPLYTVYLRTYIDSCGLYKGRSFPSSYIAYDTLHLRLLWHPKVRISLCVVSNFCLYNWNSLGERRIKHLLWWKWFNCCIVASCTTTPTMAL